MSLNCVFWAIKLEASSWLSSLRWCFREGYFGLWVATTIQTSHRPATGQLHRRKWFVTRPHTLTLHHPMTTMATPTSVLQNIQEFRPARVTHNFLPWPFKSTVSKWWVLFIPLHHHHCHRHSRFPSVFFPLPTCIVGILGNLYFQVNFVAPTEG